MIVRAHECVMDGFERFAQGHLITLFSATNYCGTANNAGAILVLGRDFVMVSVAFIEELFSGGRVLCYGHGPQPWTHVSDATESDTKLARVQRRSICMLCDRMPLSETSSCMEPCTTLHVPLVMIPL